MADESPIINPSEQGTVSGISDVPASIAPVAVNVLNPEGELVSIPQEHLQTALASGYSQPEAGQVEAHFQQEKYGSLGQQAIAGVEGGLAGAFGPIAPAIERAIGVPAEDIRGREATWPGTHIATELAGFVGPAVLSGGASLAGKAGLASAAKAAEKFTQAGVLGKAGEAVGALTGLGGAGSGFVEKVAADGIKAAFEGGLYTAGDEIGKRIKEEPEQGAGSAIAHIGMGAVMTGVFGGAIGAGLRKLGVIGAEEAAAKAAAKGAEEAGKTASKIVADPPIFIPASEKAAFEAGDLGTHIKLDQEMPAAKKEKLTEALKFAKPKKNAAQIIDAQRTLGAPVTPGMTLESPLLQMQVDTLSHSPYTLSGNRIRTALDDAWTHADNVLTEVTQSAHGLSKDELGHSLQGSLTKDIRDAYEPVKAAYAEVSELHPTVPVPIEDIGAFREGLKDIKEVALGPTTDEGRLARQIVKTLQNARTADDISVIRNMSALKKSGVGADPMGRIKGILRDRLQTLQDDAVEKYARSFPRNDEAGAVMHSLIDKNKAAQQMYKPYIRKVGELSEWLGKGKIHGTEDALNFMNERLSASDIATRLFSASKDPQFLRFFGKEFPEQFKLVRDYQRMALRDSATTGDTFSAKTFLNKFNKLEPEVQKALYSAEEIKKINAADTYLREAFPKNFNPSGTSHIMALREAYNHPKSMIMANVRDYAMEKIINRAGIKATQATELGRAAAAGEKTADKAVKAILKGDKELPSSLNPSEAHRGKLSKVVDEYQADPSKMLTVGDSNPVPAYAQAFATAAARAVQYLSSIKPNTQPTSPLDTKHTASSMQKATYNRALDITQQPLHVLARMNNGTLTPQDVITLKTVHPGVYQSISQKLMSGIMDKANKGEAIPYKLRLQMSMFLGQPLDSTMTQPAMAAMQAKTAASQQQQATAQAPASGPKRSTASLGKLASQAQTVGQARVADRSDGKL